MSAKGLVDKKVKAYPTKAERRELKEKGVNMKDLSLVLKETKELRESKKPAPAPAKPTQEELLEKILVELQKKNKKAEIVAEVVEK